MTRTDDRWMQQFELLNADGIDFMDIGSMIGNHIPKMIASYTKEEFANLNGIPKTGYQFWKIVDGRKIYIDIDENARGVQNNGW